MNHPLNHTATRPSSKNYLDDVKKENCFVCLAPNCQNSKCQEKLVALKSRIELLISQTESEQSLSEHLDICGQTGFINVVHKSFRKDIFATWEHFSGSFFHPFVNKDNSPIYEGKQRELRNDCLRYIHRYLYQPREDGFKKAS